MHSNAWTNDLTGRRITKSQVVQMGETGAVTKSHMVWMGSHNSCSPHDDIFVMPPSPYIDNDFPLNTLDAVLKYWYNTVRVTTTLSSVNTTAAYSYQLIVRHLYAFDVSMNTFNTCHQLSVCRHLIKSDNSIQGHTMVKNSLRESTSICVYYVCVLPK